MWQEVPYKLASEYELKVDYKFRERPSGDHNKVVFGVDPDEKNRKSTSGPLPYLKLELKLLKLERDEMKIVLVSSSSSKVLTRKAKTGAIHILDIGFIDDVKDKISPNEFNIFFYTDAKDPVSRIHFLIMEDGTFMVNSEQKGKF